MALAITHAGANGAVLSRDQENKLLDELFALQLAIVQGKKPQYKLSAATLKQLEATIANAPRENATVEQPKRAQQPLPGLPYATTASGIDPIFLEKSDSLIRAEGRLKRQRIERELYEQVERRKHTCAGERDGQTIALDVDNVLAKAQAKIPPVSGLKVAVPQIRDDKSSFDENDYYSSQVEKGALYDEAQEDDEYIPEDPMTGNDANDYEQITPPDEGEASDYEPGEVSQGSDDYTPEYAPPPVADSPQTQVAHNRLTQIAAPQPERVSPLTVHRNQNYELELVNGKPEMVKKARSRYDTDNARQSSASPPVNNRAGKRQKSKKRKREVEQSGRSKKRDRRSGLDTSAQYPQMAIKDEPVSPLPYSTPQQPQYEYRMVEQQPPVQLAPAQHLTQYFGTQSNPSVHVMPQRATSVMAHHKAPEQDLRRVATLHHAFQPLPLPNFRGVSPDASNASPMFPPPNFRRISPVASYAPASRPQTGFMPPPPSRLQETSLNAMMPPPAPKRVVVDQYGNRYYAAEPEAAPARASVVPESHESHFERSASRMSTVYAPSAQYDPANPRIEYVQPSRTAMTPGYTLDASEGRMPRVRSYAPQETRHFNTDSTSPVFDHRVQHEQPYGAQSVPHAGMAPPAFHYVESSRQTAPPTQMYSQDGHPLVQAAPRPYGVQPGFAQQMPIGLPPRQGSVAPVQYIRQSVQPEQNVRYIDAHGYEIQPGQNYRQY
ncbi:hypothetical protein AMS68_006204 [Peltaster fructicola]|uniref:Uncharacterized protein n=1 Tax=Peltaster fructicola TaxID=286661 RepID=A0A6H0Y100_9PEZI|nr:hypothetical protein AMS68_006204 [Peltaster fructicola]